jgi:superkiller protein 3
MLDKIWRFLKQLIQRVFRTFSQDFNPPWPPLGKGGEEETNLASPLSKGGLRGVPPTLTDTEVGREILVEFPLSSVEGDEVGDREAEAWCAGGILQCQNGDFEGGIASYDKALKFKPDLHEAWFNRGLALVKLGRREDAIASYDKALKFKPDLHEAWFNRGVALVKLGRIEDARSSWDKALKFKPDYHEAWYIRGVALVNLGRIEDARSSWDKALKFKPDDHLASKNRTIALKKLGIV